MAGLVHCKSRATSLRDPLPRERKWSLGSGIRPGGFRRRNRIILFSFVSFWDKFIRVCLGLGGLVVGLGIVNLTTLLGAAEAMGIEDMRLWRNQWYRKHLFNLCYYTLGYDWVAVYALNARVAKLYCYLKNYFKQCNTLPK